jgi:hypothetical protein
VYTRTSGLPDDAAVVRNRSRRALARRSTLIVLAAVVGCFGGLKPADYEVSAGYEVSADYDGPADVPHFLMPVPASLAFGTGRLAISTATTVAVTGAADDRLRAAVQRMMRRLESRTGLMSRTP